MRVRTILGPMVVGMVMAVAVTFGSACAVAGNEGQPPDWQRFYYYPYVYYPHNFQRPIEFDHMYYRYPPQRQIPVYNTAWHNFYPEPNPWHQGAAFILDVF
jgi:hypothetical protein